MESSEIERLNTRIRYLQALLTDNGIKFDQQEHVTQTVPKQKLLSTNLTDDVPRHLIERYSRQMLLPEIQYDGQVKICKSKVAVVGCGGIGCPLAMYLASAGIGSLGLFDSDKVQLNNLHRQIGHRTASVGKPKTTSLQQTILSLNPNVSIKEYPFVTIDTMHNLEGYDVVIDGSDNAKCRYLVSDYCVKNNKKLLSAACIGWEGQVTAYGNGSACYRCVWGNNEVSQGGCSTRGVVGMLPGIVALLTAVETIKLIVTGQTDLFGNMVLYDGFLNKFRKVKLRGKREDCIACGTGELDLKTYEYSRYDPSCSAPAPAPDVQTITWDQYVQNGKGFLLDVRSPNMYNIVRIEPSVNLPYDTLISMSKEEVKEFLEKSTDKPPEVINVSCRLGFLSRKSVDYLNKLGFKSVNVKGGIEEYGKLHDSNIPNL